MRVIDAFMRASDVYKAKHDRPQDNAKDNANDHKYISVFVSSEGSVPRRMEYDPIEIRDLSKEESINYLIDKRKVKKEEAEKLYELVGGHIIYLGRVADKSLAGQDFEGIHYFAKWVYATSLNVNCSTLFLFFSFSAVIKQSVFRKVRKKFNEAQHLLHRGVGKKAIKALLDSGELEFETFMDLFDNYEEASEILGKIYLRTIQKKPPWASSLIK
ncbi:11317_t:CDS:2 [Diversispora eburnea]|uniref:11317_t:CDS:1 n=1 Tax=Diversispora eburnea TaxID=1213867 RepID=A0A9N8W5F1_9GLOM|nr:11317_t:CDS:2 [Diversispora eburnea]